MRIKFQCECGKRFSVSEEKAGRKTKCPDCGERIVIPELESEPDSEPEAKPVKQAKKKPPPRRIRDRVGGERLGIPKDPHDNIMFKKKAVILSLVFLIIAVFIRAALIAYLTEVNSVTKFLEMGAFSAVSGLFGGFIILRFLCIFTSDEKDLKAIKSYWGGFIFALFGLVSTLPGEAKSIKAQSESLRGEMIIVLKDAMYNPSYKLKERHQRVWSIFDKSSPQEKADAEDLLRRGMETLWQKRELVGQYNAQFFEDVLVSLSKGEVYRSPGIILYEAELQKVFPNEFVLKFLKKNQDKHKRILEGKPVSAQGKELVIDEEAANILLKAWRSHTDAILQERLQLFKILFTREWTGGKEKSQKKDL